MRQGDNLFEILLSMTVLFNLFDLCITLKLVNRFGVEIELNPLAKMLINNHKHIILFKLFWVVLYVLVIYKNKNSGIAKVGNVLVFIVYGVLTCYHLINMLLIYVNS